MRSLSEQLDIIDSDNAILSKTVRAGRRLTLPGEWMPDGAPVVVDFQGDMGLSVLQQWCAIVRGQWDARKNRKEAQEAEQAAALRAAQAREVEHTDDRSGSDVPVEDHPKVGETTVEGFIRAKIVELDSARSWWKDEATAAQLRYDTACKAVTGYDQEIEAAERLLEVLNDSREVRSKDSLTFLEAEKLRERGAGVGDPMVRPTVRKHKPRRPRRNKEADGHTAGTE